ncbi:MAG: hypothetical protein F9K25_19480 [Candidatus Contendobacter sp.]|nr:MAG: hypothetical protein F9K25_19480 [Candidatus Contendobacter sp.]
MTSSMFCPVFCVVEIFRKEKSPLRASAARIAPKHFPVKNASSFVRPVIHHQRIAVRVHDLGRLAFFKEVAYFFIQARRNPSFGRIGRGSRRLSIASVSAGPLPHRFIQQSPVVRRYDLNKINNPVNLLPD